MPLYAFAFKKKRAYVKQIFTGKRCVYRIFFLIKKYTAFKKIKGYRLRDLAVAAEILQQVCIIAAIKRSSKNTLRV